ncbi:MAG: response regulator [bacterium]
MAGLKRILLVEENYEGMEMTLTALDEYNLANHVDVVHDGKQALDYLYRRGDFKTRAEGNPIVVLLNLNIPKVAGLEVLRQIKSDRQLQIIPVVVINSSRNKKDLVESYKLGVNAYVVKSDDFQQFFEAVMGLGLFWGLINEPPDGCVNKTE